MSRSVVYGSDASSASELSLLIEPFRAVFRNWRLIVTTLHAEIAKRYIGSALGRFWLVFPALFFLGEYALLYLFVYKISVPSLSEAQYVLFIFCGLMSFLSFSDSLVSGTLALSQNRVLLMNTVFPAELITLRTVLTAQTVFILGTLIALCFSIAIGRFPWTIILVPVVMILQIMFLIGLTWILSPLALIFRDLQYMIGWVCYALLILSPIAFTREMIPRRLAPLIYANPLSYFVMSFQDLIVFGKIPSLFHILVMFVLSLFIFIIGFRIFDRVKGIANDYV